MLIFFLVTSSPALFWACVIGLCVLAIIFWYGRRTRAEREGYQYQIQALQNENRRLKEDYQGQLQAAKDENKELREGYDQSYELLQKAVKKLQESDKAIIAWKEKLQESYQQLQDLKSENSTLNAKLSVYQQVSAPTIDKQYIPDALRQSVLERDSYRCRMCSSNSYLEMDHIIPRSKGGATSYDNLQVLCHGCNQKKGNR